MYPGQMEREKMKRMTKVENESFCSYSEITDRCIRRENEIVTRLADLSVDVVLPVYNDSEHLSKLLSMVDKTTLEHRIILIDDASTEEETLKLIDEYIQEHPNTRLIRNERNLGYIPSINRGLVVTRSPQVALLSTDLLLPENWLERLVMPLIKDPTVASCSPFSNHASITSFPYPLVENHQFDDRPLEEVDQVFQEIRSLYTTIPYGNISCMAMNRQVIHEIGIFDQNVFQGEGGAEIDWSLRAVKAGYRHVVVENLYIYRSHRANFQSLAKLRQKQRYQNEIKQRYPEFETAIKDYLAKDDLSSVKIYAFLRLTAPSVKRRTLIIQNDGGHGAEAYIQDQIAERSVRSEVTFLLRYLTAKGRYQIDYRFEDNIFSMMLDSFEEVCDLSKRFDINGIIVNQLSGYPALREHLEAITRLAGETGASLIDIIHNYLPICPRLYLRNAWENACDVPAAEECAKCLAASSHHLYYETASIEEWRKMWQTFLLSCEEVRVFSQDSLRLMRKAFPGLDRIHVMPERHSIMDAISRTYSEDDTIGIGILGDLTELKGVKRIKAMVEKADKLKLPIRFELLGKCEERIKSPRFHVSPLCTEEEFPAAILGLGIDAIFVSSIYPETFSYTTQQAIEMDLPCICFPLGAPVERLYRYDKGLVLGSMEPQDHLEEIMAFVEKHRAPKAPQSRSVLIVESRHTTPLEHFRTVQMTEQLVQQGIVVSVVNEEQLQKAGITQYNTIVLMEVRWEKRIKKVLDLARRSGIKIWSQVDTVGYDLHYLNGYEFFTPEEKEMAEIHCASLAATMEYSDGILVPTETMAGIIARDFPEKKICVWEGLATYPMRALARKERQRPRAESEKVVMAFVTSRHYGGVEFYEISESLKTLMSEHPLLSLLVIGDIDIPDSFKPFSSRIEQVHCRTWQDYMKQLSKADIHLLPLTDTLSSRNLVGISFMMASLLQTPTVATDSKESRRVIYAGRDGMLYQSQQELVSSLEKLVSDPSMRYAQGEYAYYRIIGDRTTEKIDEAFFSIFE